MAGLLNPNQSAPQAPQAGGMPQAGGNAGADTLNDPVLKQIEQGIEDSIPAEKKDAYLAIVVAGMQIMFSKETSQLLDRTLAMEGDPATNIAQGIPKLLILIYNESRKAVPDGQEGGMDVTMAVPAAITLLCQAADYAEQVKAIEVTPELMAKMTKETMTATLKAFGISEDQINKTIQAGQQAGAQGQAAPEAPAGGAPQPMMGA